MKTEEARHHLVKQELEQKSRRTEGEVAALREELAAMYEN